MIEIVPREHLDRVLRDPVRTVGGVPHRALASDAGRLGSPSRLARMVGPGSRAPAVIRWVPRSSLVRTRPPAWRVAALLVRPMDLSRGVVPAAVGLASAGAAWDDRAALVLLAVACVQAAAHLLNELRDHLAGPDALIGPRGTKVLQRGWATPRGVAGGAAVLLVPAMAAGLYLASGKPVALLAALGGAVAAMPFVASSALPRRGPVAPLLFALAMGPLPAVGAALATTGTAPPATWAGGAVAGLAAGLYRHVADLRRMPDDAARGLRSPALLLGFARARDGSRWLGGAVGAVPVLLHVAGLAPASALAGPLALPLLAWALAPALRAETPHDPGLARALRRLGPASWLVGAVLVLAFWA
ncbi:UbiA family prenyltransferase [Myxococcota bacterium]|nr:UbiA family prenyltransferase [Myxococcota bacterium]